MTYLNSQDLVLVAFTVPWCGYCETLAPVLDHVAKSLHDQNVSAKIAKIDLSMQENEVISSQEKIDGLPTLLLYRAGVRYNEYHGNRSENDLLEYMLWRSGPPARFITSQVEILPYLNALELADNLEHGLLAVVVGVFLPDVQDDSSSDSGSSKYSIDSDAAQVFYEVARQYDLAIFFVTNSSEMIKEFKIEENSIVIFTAEEHDVSPAKSSFLLLASDICTLFHAHRHSTICRSLLIHPRRM